MPTLCKIKMSWEEAPEDITPKELGWLRGICIDYAREEFKKRGFPKYDRYRAKKKALMKYYGIPSDEEEENKLVVSELKKIRKLLEEVLAGTHEKEMEGVENA